MPGRINTLPINAVLPSLIAQLRDHPNAVVIAPPGAGKTTAVAPAILDQIWCTGKILMLSPRRLAARAAAERMAELAGEPVGQTIGYATRMDSKQSAKTRILVQTEGIFRNQIQADPELEGVSAVLFDEVHERSLDSDFGLALALDIQAALRPDLRLIAMSATLDGSRFADLMRATVIESEGRSHPLTLQHIGRRAELRIEDDMAEAIRTALAQEDGDILAFLPGVAEIERTAERLDGIPAILHRLHGSLDPADQRAAIRKGDRRKVILATSIAETSVTIDGVRVVIDSGLARRPRYDRAAGMTRLVTERASQAAATQRAGRAARQGPGIAIRLWEEAATAGLLRFDPPEIVEADLSALLLDCALWGVADPRSLRWLDPPSKAAIDEALKRLVGMNALDGDCRPTAHGKAMAKIPLPPRLAHMLIESEDRGFGSVAAEAAVLLSERGIGGSDIDLDTRLERWRRDKGQRAEAARSLARRWRSLVERGNDGYGDFSTAIAIAFPDRVARRRDKDGGQWISVGGRGFRLDSASPLARADWLAVAETQGIAAGARIVAAAAINFAEVETLFGDQIHETRIVRFDPTSGNVTATRERKLGAITLSKGNDDEPDPEAITAALLDGVREGGLEILLWSSRAQSLRQRGVFAGISALSDAALLEKPDVWLAPLLEGKRKLSDITGLTSALEAMLGWDTVTKLNALAPESFTSPVGTTHPIDYAAAGGPKVELRVQALFGVSVHPTVGTEAIPLVLRLTSPGGKPIQTTRDLPGFWAGSWADVAKEMRGRYPKHDWPDNPANAVASLRTKRAQARR